MNCRGCGEDGCQRQRCPGPICGICDRAFHRRWYSGNLERAQRARDQHESTHPKFLSCSQCSGAFQIEYQRHGKEALERATQKRDEHQANCSGWPCPHCSEHLNSLEALKRHEILHWHNGTYNAGQKHKDDEHAILLGATFVDEFCLVAWHCEEQRLFRVIGPDKTNKFWSREDFEDLNLRDGDGFRFRRHTSQNFHWDWSLPHILDNIRVFDISPAHVKKSILVSPGSVRDLLNVDAFGPDEFSAADSSFALLNVTNLKFYERANRRVTLRCSFRDADGKWFNDIPVVNYSLQQCMNVPVASAAATTVVLGLSCNGYKLMFDSWLPDYS